VLTVIVIDVPYGSAYFSGSLEHSRMIAVAKDPSAALHHTIEALGNAHRQPLDGARHRRVVRRFDEQMDMIALHTETHDLSAKAP
jgi:hypothetical protein